MISILRSTADQQMEQRLASGAGNDDLMEMDMDDETSIWYV